MRAFWGFLFCLIFILAGTLSVSAVSFDGISAFPANPNPDNTLTNKWFLYELEPGQQKEDALIIQNLNDDPISVEIYAVDSTLNDVGGLSLKERDDIKNEIGAWINLSESTLSLAPQEEKRVPFTISVPSAADVGEHFGGIVIETSNVNKKQLQEAGIQVPTKMALRVYQTVPGTMRKELTLNAFSHEAYWNQEERAPFGIFSYDIENTGNASTQAILRLRYENYFFGLGNTEETKEILISREAHIQGHFDVRVPQFGFFKAFLTVSYENEHGQMIHLQGNPLSFFSFPWVETIIIVGVIFILLIISLFRHLGLSWRRKSLYIYDVQEGDDILLVAEKTNTPWKKIALYNNLKKPYVLTPETALYVHCPPEDGVEVDVEDEDDEEYEEAQEVETDVLDPQEMNDIEQLDEPLKKSVWMNIVIGFLIALILVSGVLLILFYIQSKHVSFSLEQKPGASTHEAMSPIEPPTLSDETQDSVDEVQVTIDDEAAQEEEEQIPSFDPSTITVHVFNGTSITGKARQIQQLLQEQEFDVPLIGNANRANTDESIILYSADLKDQALFLQQKLSELEIESVLVEETKDADYLTLLVGAKELGQ